MDIRIAVTLACALIGALSIPLLLGKVPPNHLYGFRTSRTLSRADIWYPANRFSAKAMLVTMAVTSAITWALPRQLPELTPVLLLLAAIGIVLVVSLRHLRNYG